MNILGLSAFYHDSAAALVSDGVIVAASQEERFSRRKFDARFPTASIRSCLEIAGLEPAEIDVVAFYDDPELKFDRLVKTHLAYAPFGFSGFTRAARALLGGKANQLAMLEVGLREIDASVPWRERIAFNEHHLSHAAGAFFPSPFESAAILTMDGVGEWATTTIAHGRGKDLKLLKEIHFPHSIGLLYAAFTDYLGFKVNSDEYKVMGLAPYGTPRFCEKILSHLIRVDADGTFTMDMRYFAYHAGKSMVNARFGDVFGQPQRSKDPPLLPFHMDVAASLQAVTEEIVTRLARHALAITGESRLCLSGGVALNCVANGKVLKLPEVSGLWIQPAAGDAGSALGAALSMHYTFGGKRVATGRDSMAGSLLGPSYTQEEIERALAQAGLTAKVYSDDASLCGAVADLLAGGKVVGWFQGRMEFGPRALGARSILGDPRNASLQRIINLKVKYRESFRPFAPIVLEEHAAQWFDLKGDSPYMLIVAPVAASRHVPIDPVLTDLTGTDRLEVIRSQIPAVTHVDYSARVQTVDQQRNPLLRHLLEAFHSKTGCPVLINTSFNVNEEPIVCSPDDAIRCFMSTNIDALCLGRAIVMHPGHPDEVTEAPVPESVDLDNLYTVF